MSESTWEPASNLVHCAQKLDKFNKSQQSEPSTPAQTKSKAKAKGKGKNARKGAMPPPAVPDAAGPSPADATAVAVADASGSLKRAGSPTEGDRPAKASTISLHTRV